MGHDDALSASQEPEAVVQTVGDLRWAEHLEPGGG